MPRAVLGRALPEVAAAVGPDAVAHLGREEVGVDGMQKGWKTSENHRKTDVFIGKPWENHGKTHRKMEIFPPVNFHINIFPRSTFTSMNQLRKITMFHGKCYY